MNRGSQSGVAIVTALVVVGIVAVIGVSVAWRQSLWLRQLESSGDLAQARVVAKAGTMFARVVLWDDQRRSTVDHLREGWTTRLPPTPVDGGEITGGIADLQGLFNLNNIVRDGQLDQGQLAQYRRLLAMLGLQAPLADYLVDWMDPDSTPRGANGAEDAYYLAQVPPYRSANRPLDTVEDLGQVRGYTPDVLRTLGPFVSVATGFTAINVNTAPPIVLASMFSGMSLADAQGLAGERDRIYFKDRADFFARFPRPDFALGQESIGAISEYFMVDVQARYGRAAVTSRALLHRQPGAWPEILWQRFE